MCAAEMPDAANPASIQPLPHVARALWIVAEGQAELREEALLAPAPGEVLVQTLYSGFSRGTERLIFQGRVPPSEYARMRAPFQSGDFPYPVKYGYANVGRVLAAPAALLGREVFCLYPHQTAYVVPASAVLPLPAGLPAARAVLAANMETALNGIWDAQLRAGDRVCVVGAGVVGCLVAYLAARHPGCSVQLVDVDARKAGVAERMGASFALPEAVARDCDVVLHASGAASGLTLALEAAGLEARVVELSWYGDAQVSLALGAGFHAQRLQLCSSQVGRVPSVQAPRWSTQRRLALALSLLEDPALDALISSESAFARAPQVLAELARAERLALCHRLEYETT
jgi:threonine dehydrogenase-like Zn-dependent dehydrogenase